MNDVNTYISSARYNFGDVVRLGLQKFKCKGYPYGLWCLQKVIDSFDVQRMIILFVMFDLNLASKPKAYGPLLEPGIWQDAWTKDGTCPSTVIEYTYRTVETTSSHTINLASTISVPTNADEKAAFITSLEAEIAAMITPGLDSKTELVSIAILTVNGASIRRKVFRRLGRQLETISIKFRAVTKTVLRSDNYNTNDEVNDKVVTDIVKSLNDQTSVPTVSFHTVLDYLSIPN